MTMAMNSIIPPSRRRLLVMPLLVLLVGCAVAWWSSLKHEREREEVRSTVARLMTDVCAGRDVALPVPVSNLTPNILETMLREELGKTCANGGGIDALEVHVSAGDKPMFGGSAGAATHTALIRTRADLRVLLLLRVQRADDGTITIIGYETPPAAPSAPATPPESSTPD